MGCTCSSLKVTQEDIRDLYVIGDILGSGAFGQVRECIRRSDGTVLAVKIMERRSKEKGHWSNESMFRREVQLLGLLEHPNIIQYFDFYEDKHFLYAVVEKCDGGELFDQIVLSRRFVEEDAACLCRQMLLALAYIHSHGVVHRDIKAENFLFKGKGLDSELKLIDFGMSAKLSSKAMTLGEVCGSPHYLAPELIRKNYGHKADIWALGVLIYLMLFGRYPFDGKTTDAIVKQIISKPLDWKSNNVAVSSNAVDFMSHLLESNASSRYTATEALDHVWIKQAIGHEIKTEWASAPDTGATITPPPPVPSTAGVSQTGRSPLSDAFDGSGGSGEDGGMSPQRNLIESVRSAKRKITLARSGFSAKADARRNQLLNKLERDWKSGLRNGGVRISTLAQPQAIKPEFARRYDRRMNTAPSRYLGGSLADVRALRRAMEDAEGHQQRREEEEEARALAVDPVVLTSGGPPAVTDKGEFRGVTKALEAGGLDEQATSANSYIKMNCSSMSDGEIAMREASMTEGPLVAESSGSVESPPSSGHLESHAATTPMADSGKEGAVEINGKLPAMPPKGGPSSLTASSSTEKSAIDSRRVSRRSVFDDSSVFNWEAMEKSHEEALIRKKEAASVAKGVSTVVTPTSCDGPWERRTVSVQVYSRTLGMNTK